MKKQSLFLKNKYIVNFEKSLNLKPIYAEKPKSLKDRHFTNFYEHIFSKLTESNDLKSFSSKENITNIFNYQNKNQISTYSNTEHPITNYRNFKDPKNINYKLLKFNPYRTSFRETKNEFNDDMSNSNKKRKRKRSFNSEKIKKIKEVNEIAFYNIKFKKNKEEKNECNNNDKNQKIIVKKNNMINKKEYIDIVNKIKLYNENEKKKRIKAKKYYENNVREGYFGKKDTFGIPYYYDTSIIFKNEYANKSEKKRHEILLNEFNKLKSYLLRHADKRLYIIKDFLNKFHIDEIEKYNNKQLLNLSDFILNVDNNIISSCLKPYLNIKNMLYDIMNNSLDLNNLYFDDNNNNKNNNEIINNNIYENNSNSKIFDNCYKEMKSNNNINIEKKKKYYLSPLIKNRKSKYLTQSVKINRRPIYKSNILFNETKTDDNIFNGDNLSNDKRKSVILDLNATNSNLKYMKYQKKTFFPHKSFVNNNTIINEIGKEIKDIENDYNEKLKELELMKNSENKKHLFNLSNRHSLFFETKDKLYINIKNNNTRLKTLIPIHYSLTKNFNGEMINFNEINDNYELLNSENNVYRKSLLSMDNCWLNSTEIKNKDKNLSVKNKKKHKGITVSLDKSKNSKTKNKTDVIKRLYYIPTRKKFGLQEIRNRLKLTEYITLTRAKKNIYNKKIIQIINMK